MRRNKEYDARERALQDMGEKRKDRIQEDGLKVKESKLPVFIVSAFIIVVICAFVISRILV